MLIFDGDCGFCTVTARWIETRLRTPVPVVPWQEIHDLSELGLTVDDVTTAAYYVDVYGHIYRGHEAVSRFLRLCRGAYPVLGVLMGLPPFDALARAAYRLVANNRHRLPGGTAQCALPRPVSFEPDRPDRAVSAR